MCVCECEYIYTRGIYNILSCDTKKQNICIQSRELQIHIVTKETTKFLVDPRYTLGGRYSRVCLTCMVESRAARRELDEPVVTGLCEENKDRWTRGRSKERGGCVKRQRRVHT